MIRKGWGPRGQMKDSRKTLLLLGTIEISVCLWFWTQRTQNVLVLPVRTSPRGGPPRSRGWPGRPDPLGTSPHRRGLDKTESWVSERRFTDSWDFSKTNMSNI